MGFCCLPVELSSIPPRHERYGLPLGAVTALVPAANRYAKPRRAGSHSENVGTNTSIISTTKSTRRYFIIGRHTFSSFVPVIAQVAKSPNPIGGENNPSPIAITHTVPKCSG